MKVLPELNLNKHPQKINDGGLCYAENIIVSKDTAVIQSEPVINNSKFHLKMKEHIGEDFSYKLKFIIPCNKEIVAFIENELDSSKLNVYRYSEELNEIDDTGCIVENHGGEFIGTFTYNNNSLIVAFSEYDYKNKLNIPLRTIELGKFNNRYINNQKYEITDTTLQPLVAKALIPYLTGEFIDGHNAYKGFYYFFVRFKINHGIYTQWYNTNASFLLDNSSENIYFDLKGPDTIFDQLEDNDYDLNVATYNSYAKAYMSNKEEICNRSIKVTFSYNNNFSDKVIKDGVPYYDTLQIGYCILHKGFSKAYRSPDLKFNYGYENYHEYIINPIYDIETSLDELITTYHNYYNVKSITNNNNKLYIGNYLEKNSYIDLSKEDITINISINQIAPDDLSSDIDPDNPLDPDDPNREVDHYSFRLERETPKGKEFIGEVKAYEGINGCYYYDLSDCFIFKFNKSNNIAYSGYGANSSKTYSEIWGVVTDEVNSNPVYTIEKRNYISTDFDKNIDGNSNNSIILVNRGGTLTQSIDNDGTKLASIVGTTNGIQLKYTGGSYSISPEDIHVYPTVYTSFDYKRLIYTNSLAGIKNQTIKVEPGSSQGIVYRINESGKEIPLTSSAVDFFNTINYPLIAIYDTNGDSLYKNNENIAFVSYTPCYMEDPKEWTSENPTYAALVCGENKSIGDYHNIWTLVAYDKNNKEIYSIVNGGGNFTNKSNSRFDDYINKNIGKKIILGQNTDKDGGTNAIDNCYNFFIHFVDKYGIATRGYNFSEFSITHNNENIDLYYYINSIGNRIFRYSNGTISLNIPKLPSDYFGYFVSYEKPEFDYVYMCHYKISPPTNGNTNEIYCYSGEFDLFDNINWNFDQIAFIGNFGFNIDDSQSGLKNILNYTVTGIARYSIVGKEKRNIISKIILPADAADNMGQESAIKIVVDGEPFTSSTNGFLYLIKKRTIYNDYNGHYIIDAYNNENKTLIPCSPIQYSTASVIINTKTAFKTNCYCLDYIKDLVFDTVLNQFKQENSVNIVRVPLHHLRWEAYRPNNLNYKSYNNEPQIIIAPIKGLNTTNVNEKTFARGKIVQLYNSIDLFEYRHYTYFDAYPKSLDWNNPKVLTNETFTKTIRRSNIIQDESFNNAWRQFPIEQYKTINENKGDIIKLISIGTAFIVHTEHSLFIFSKDEGLKTSDDSLSNKIQLASVDIWDIDYKELLSSTLGRGGITKEYHGIIGDYGYIWYDSDVHRIYRFDANNFIEMDESIVNFLNKLNDYDVNIVEDVKRDRILFNFNKDDKNRLILSYNYKTNTFVSFHNYVFDKGYNTKNEIYLITNTDNNTIVKDYNDFNIVYYNNATIKVVINTDFVTMKKIEYVTYNVRRVIQRLINDYSPVERLDDYYSGDYIRIYNNIFDTGYIDISNSNVDNINRNYEKPYWRFGNWHFNYIWNKIKENDNIIDNSKVLGNYFVIEFKFNTNKQIEIENVNVNYTNGELS